MATNPDRFFSFHSSEPVRVLSFEDLRYRTELHYEYDRILHKLRPYTNMLTAYNIEWSVTMPNRNNSKYQSDWRFINITLSAADERNFVDWYAKERNNVVNMLGDVTANSYKFSVSYDFDNVCYIATLSSTKFSSVNSGSSITARSEDFLEAVCLLLYKHFIMCQAGDWAEHARPSNWG